MTLLEKLLIISEGKNLKYKLHFLLRLRTLSGVPVELVYCTSVGDYMAF